MENINGVKQEFKNSKVLISNRTKTSINGITKMITSNETNIYIEIQNEPVLFEGQNLHITKLDVENQVIEIDGVINSMKYTKAKGNKNFVKRIFS